jgi:hypothetical protein
VPLMILLGALSAKPWAALGVGALFGLARGLAVLLGARLSTPAALLAFHQRFDAWSGPVRETVIGAELAVAVAAAWMVAPPAVATGLGIAAIALSAQRLARTARAPRTSVARAATGGARAHRRV